ncbi:MAG TPA: asparagine synthase-related protein [Trueperaceae bacterium]
MSGIAAVVYLDGRPAKGSELTPMLTELERVGPDGTSFREVGPAALGCARFDTLPEDGPQPVTFDGVTVVADARLDNRNELWRLLEASRTSSEAVLIASAIAKWGEKAPEHLEGDFAVIAWDGRERKLIAFRDRFGVRQLFLAEAPWGLLLATTIDALLAHPLVDGRFDPDYFISYFATRRVTTPLTPYRSIKRLERASTLIATRQTMWQSNYYRLEPCQTSARLDEAAETVRHLLEQSVKARLRASVPVSCEVSGGMDSTSVFAIARSHSPDIEARTLVSERLPQVDERRYNRELIGDSPWRQVLVDDLLSLEGTPCSTLFGEPVLEAALGHVRISLYHPFRLIRLTGHGGDALMSAGYALVNSLIKRGRFGLALQNVRAWADSRDRPILRTLRYATRPGMIPKSRFVWATERVKNQAEQSVSTLRNSVRGHSHRPEVTLFNLYIENGNISPYLPLDIRHPFLDRQLVEYSLGLPADVKCEGAVEKLTLRRATTDLLPRRILDRNTKSSFDALYAWSAYQNRSRINTWLDRPCLAALGVLQADGIKSLAHALSEGRRDRITEAMIIISTEAWLQGRIDRSELGSSPAPAGNRDVSLA